MAVGANLELVQVHAPANAENSSTTTKDHDTVNQQEAANKYGAAYLSFLRRFKAVWKDLPDVAISYENLAYTIPVDVKEHGVTNLVKSVYHGVQGIFRPHRKMDLLALAPSTGVIKPGTMTLILAPPGHGKSTFLKALAGHLDGDRNLSGAIKYNGMSRKEAQAAGVYVSRLCAYVGQTENHFSTLTVKETFEFAATNSIPDASLLGDAEFTKLDKERPDLIMGLLGLEECANTIVGDALLRGISGGQKRRTTIGEILITNARAFFLDEVSTGLDAAVTLHIFEALRQYTRIMHGSIVTALLQPTPETYEQFDDIILMKGGYIVYHGPRNLVRSWLKDSVGLEMPHGVDEAGFLVDFLADPEQMIRNKQIGEGFFAPSRSRDTSRETTPQTAVLKAVNLNVVVPPLPAARVDMNAVSNALSIPHRIGSTARIKSSTADLLTAFHETQIYQKLLQDVKAVENDATVKKSLDLSHWSEYTKRQYGSPYPHSMLVHGKFNLIRQAKLIRRDKTMVIPRIMSAIFNGVVYGTLFIGLGSNDFLNKYGLLVFILMNCGFNNFAELPVADQARHVVSKQLGAGFYPAITYVFSVILSFVPIIALDTILFTTIMYWLPGLAPEAGRYFFLMFCFFVTELAMSTFFRSIAYSAKNVDVARQMSMPVFTVMLLFCGFMILRNKIPDWLIWLYWINPMAWGLRSLAQNEFLYSGYDSPISGSGSSIRAGDQYLAAYSFETDPVYKWAGIAFNAGCFLLFSMLCAWLLVHVTPPAQLGTKRVIKKAVQSESSEEDEASDLAEDGMISPDAIQQTVSVNIEQPIPTRRSTTGAASKLSALPFTPVTLAWKDISYTVFVQGTGKNKKTVTPKQLLHNVNGFAKPGTLTALMGSSGAGKTTLMDVIAGRKTVGEIKGSILLNGHPQDLATFSRISGYVEQQDLHVATATVREALITSAKLRLPESVDTVSRETFVDQVIELVGLTSISHRMIGDISLPGLSPGQLKLVTIAVELVANPAIIFLDEPTSGLDAPSAARVMKAVRRIASTGRSVLCTIHQPSAELFYMFDRLLLLKSGGYEVFFGDIGSRGHRLVEYLEAADGLDGSKLPAGINPANWMLDVINPPTANVTVVGEESSSSPLQKKDFAEIWSKSELRQKANRDVESASKPVEGSAPLKLDYKYPGNLIRFMEIQKRSLISQWRNPPVNVTRVVLNLVIGIFFGLIYLQISKTDFAGIQSLSAVIFLGMAFPASMASVAAVPGSFRNRAVFYRERSSSMYGLTVYNLTNTITELPYLLLAVVAFFIPFYWMVGLASDVALFFKFLLIIFLMALVFHATDQCFLAFLPNDVVANVLNGLVLGLFFIFGGLFIRPSAMPAGWKWFYYLDPIPKAYIAASMPQLEYFSTPGNLITIPGYPTAVSPYGYLSEQIEGYSDQYGAMIGYLLLTAAVLRLFSVIGFRFVSHIKR
eukprot:GILJ01003891.1.p1 GENE.GILJ01003891.1~~GILJ01003891.1.p1  ORF type:complete len:1450 (-),score=269.52 GILJ01003891.1:263-4612(-)